MVLFRAPETFELLRRRRELVEARALLAAREQLAGDLRTQLVSFEGRYIRQVGLLFRRLDEWERKIAELHGNSESQRDDGPEDKLTELAEVSPAQLKATFRDLVRLVHPDFAADAADEARRTRLMSQANDAYLREDLAALKRMLNGYDPAVALTSAEAIQTETTRLLASIFQVTQDIEAVNLQIEELQRSDSAKLRLRAFEAAREGRDLLAEMAARVNGSIGLAMRRYDLDLSRKANPPKGPSVESVVTAETAGS